MSGKGRDLNQGTSPDRKFICLEKKSWVCKVKSREHWERIGMRLFCQPYITTRSNDEGLVLLRAAFGILQRLEAIPGFQSIPSS